MPDAHDAAVEAMAAALDSGGDYRCGVCGERDLYHEADYAGAARRALAALVRSEAVRAALVDVLVANACPALPEDRINDRVAQAKADAILAALRPDDEGAAG